MSVAELIEILSRYPRDMEVRIADWQEQCQAPEEIREHEITVECGYQDLGDFLKLGNDND